MRKSTWIAAGTALLVISTSARATIRFDAPLSYFETDISIPAVAVSPAMPGIVSIVIERQTGDDPETLQGARFAITGLPAGWSMGLIANPALVVVGDPAKGRIDVHFLACQSLQFGQTIPVMQVTLFATSYVERHSMYIVSGLPEVPSRPGLLSCDPDPVELPTWGGQLVLNPYPIAVDNRSWSTIKSLYRE